jgi:hypothetical protein
LTHRLSHYRHAGRRPSIHDFTARKEDVDTGPPPGMTVGVTQRVNQSGAWYDIRTRASTAESSPIQRETSCIWQRNLPARESQEFGFATVALGERQFAFGADLGVAGLIGE